MIFKKEWFNDDLFWETFAPVMFDDAHWAEVEAVADGITHLARLDLYRAEAGADLREPAAEEPGARAAPPSCLDLCCGFGRIGLELARRGFSVTGVDITAPYLETAREDAAAQSLSAEFIHEDVRSFRRPGAFDAAVNLYNSFGYFADPADDCLLVKNAFDSLRRGGVFFIETLGKELAVRDFAGPEWFRRAGYFVFTEYEALDSWAAVKNTWRLVPENGGRVIEKTFVHRLYAASELRALLFDAGFGKVELYGDWDERPYDQRAVKLVAVGRKTA